MMRISGGLLVAVEGIDGAGKTSVSTLLAQFCGERGIACTLSKEPTGLRWGTELRRSANEGRLTLDREMELFELDRRDHVARSIKPALDEGNIVILDRYYWSSIAYQGSRGADTESILQRNEAFAPKPDLVLLLDVPVEVGINRIRQRGDKPNLFESESTLMKAREIFLSLGKDATNATLINSDRPIRDVFEESLTVFQKLIVGKIASGGVAPENINSVLALLGGDSILTQES